MKMIISNKMINHLESIFDTLKITERFETEDERINYDLKEFKEFLLKCYFEIPEEFVEIEIKGSNPF